MPYRDEPQRCTRSMRHTVGGGVESTLQKLRWWCMRAFDTGTKAEHQDEPREGPLHGELPSMETLERMELPQWYIDRCKL